MDDDPEYVQTGPDQPLPTVDECLGRRLYRSLTTKSCDPLVINGATEERLSSAEVLQRGISFAVELRARGIRPGDVVSLALENCIEFSFMTLGTQFAGAILAPVDPNLDEHDHNHIFRTLDPRIVFVLPRIHDTLKRLVPENTEIVVVNYNDTNWTKFIEQKEEKNFEPTSIENLDEPAVILCSSGTTGIPKGVIVTHKSLITLKKLNWMLKDDENTVACLVTPIFWATGLILSIFVLDSCKTVVIFPKFEPEAFLRAVEKYKVTSTIFSPQHITAVAKSSLAGKYDTSSLLPICAGGAPASLTLKKEAENVLKTHILLVFGQTEAMYPFFMYGPKIYEKPGSCGMVGINCSIKIADVETGKALGPNQEGELCLRLPIPFPGYYNNPHARKNVIDNYGWHHTGDVGYYDEDGYFYIYDRIKELIKYKGIHLYPGEIEDVLLTHLGVRDAAVVGIFHVTDQEHPVAFVVKQPGATVTEEELHQLTREKLPEYKRLHGGILFVDEIPRTPSGKILRRKLRQQAAQFYKQSDTYFTNQDRKF